MDEFKFQIYLSNIERLKGTKGPLKKIINELFSKYLSAEYFTSEQALSSKNVVQLIFTAEHYSKLERPFTKAQALKLYDYVNKIIQAYSLSPNELNNLIEFFCLERNIVTLYPTKVDQYIMALRYKEALTNNEVAIHPTNYSLKVVNERALERSIAVHTHKHHKTKLEEYSLSKQKEDLKAIEAAIDQLQILHKDLHEHINSTDVE